MAGVKAPSIYAHILGLQSLGEDTWKATESIRVGLSTMSANLLKPERVPIFPHRLYLLPNLRL